MTFNSPEMRRYAAGFALAGALMTIIFLAIVNYVTSRQYPWFIYPAFAVLWWPLSVIFARRNPKVYSIFGSLIIVAFLTIDNLLFSPFYLWVLYAAFPVICWPVILHLGRAAARLPAALAVSCLAIAYYLLLNMLYSPGFPWFIFPAYAVLWWPLAVVYARRGKMMQLSLAGSLITILFFIVLNAVTTPSSVWAVFPIFAILWWPLTIYCFVFKKKLVRE